MEPGRDPRTLRQRLVSEIGDAGQARIAAALGLVTEVGLAGEIEARSLAGAGFGCVRVSSHFAARAAKEVWPEVVLATDAPRIAGPSPAAIEPLRAENAHESVLAVARGAARALHQIRSIAVVAVALSSETPTR